MRPRTILRLGALALPSPSRWLGVGACLAAALAAPLGAQQGTKREKPFEKTVEKQLEKSLEKSLQKPLDDLRIKGKVLEGKLLELEELQGALFDALPLEALELQGKLLEGQLLAEAKLVDLDVEQLDLQGKLLDLEGQLSDGIAIKGKMSLGDRLGEKLLEKERFEATVSKFDGGEATWKAAAPTWHPDDPADSAYRAAYQLFSRQEYRGAAERFAALRAQHPTTRYFCDASYFEAFARYRLGTPTDLRSARRVLDGMEARCAGASRLKDVPELLTRVDGALARLGDSEAADRVRRAASEGRRVCDREERNVKIQALSALAQMDRQGTQAILEQVLAQKDECSAPVRREALQLVARGGDGAAVATLARSARNDPDAETRMAAVEALGRIQADPAYAAIEELLRTSTDEHVQAAAVRAMTKSESPRAQATVRALAERQDVSERLRASVIRSIASKGDTPTEYWRSLYGKVESDELRRAVVNAVDRNGGDGVQFLLTVAGDPATSSSVRSLAVSRVHQSAPIADLYRLFEAADTRSVRQTIVSALAARREPEATDRLIDIAKRSTDPEVRASAIRYLGQPARRDDPRVRKALGDILGGQS